MPSTPLPSGSPGVIADQTIQFPGDFTDFLKPSLNQYPCMLAGLIPQYSQEAVLSLRITSNVGKVNLNCVVYSGAYAIGAGSGGGPTYAAPYTMNFTMSFGNTFGAFNNPSNALGTWEATTIGGYSVDEENSSTSPNINIHSFASQLNEQGLFVLYCANTTDPAFQGRMILTARSY